MTSAGRGSSVSQARDAGSRVVKVFDSSFKEMKKGRWILISSGEAYKPPVSWDLFYFCMSFETGSCIGYIQTLA